MKKSLVVLLATLFTLAFASATLAADLSWWGGGDMYFYYDSDERGLLESPGTFMLLNTTIAVSSGNSWAKAWLCEDKWRTPDARWCFAFGVDKIGDVLSLGFSSKDTGIANIGQVPITDNFNTYHADPVFNTYDMPYSVNAVLALGNVTVKAEYNVAPDPNPFTWGVNNPDFSALAGNYAVAIVNKLETGEVHVGYKATNQDGYLVLVGGAAAIGDASVKVDVWKDHGQFLHEWDGSSTVGNYANDNGDLGVVGSGVGAQVNVGYNNTDFTLFVYNPEDNSKANELGVALGYKLTDKVTLEGKYFKDYNGTDNAWKADVNYNVGAFSVIVGALDLGTADDTSFILGFHAGLW